MDASWNSEKSWSNGRKDTGSLGNGSSSQSGSAPSGKFKAAIVKIGNLSMKEVVCLSHGDLSNHSASCHTLGTVGKPSMSRGAPSWFHNVPTYGGEVIEYWTIFPLKFIWIKTKNIGKFVCTLSIIGKPSMNGI